MLYNPFSSSKRLGIRLGTGMRVSDHSRLAVRMVVLELERRVDFKVPELQDRWKSSDFISFSS